MAKAYTLATYKVIAGKEDEFIERWKNLASTFSSLPDPPYWGTLIRSTTERTLFHSFGPWEDASHVRAMRNNSDAGRAFEEIDKLCIELTPGDYEIVTEVKVRKDTSAEQSAAVDAN